MTRGGAAEEEASRIAAKDVDVWRGVIFLMHCHQLLDTT